MTSVTSQIYNIEFDPAVKLKFQESGGLMEDAVYVKNNVNAKTVEFRKADSLIALPIGSSAAPVFQNPNFNKVTASMTKYAAQVILDDVEEFYTNVDVMLYTAKMMGMALRRRADQVIIDALAAVNTVTVDGISNVIANGGTGFTYDKWRQIMGFFGANNVIQDPEVTLHLAVSGAGNRQLLSNTQFTQDFYMDYKAIVNQAAFHKYKLGPLMVHVIGNMTEGGLPRNSGTSVTTCFAWASRCVGLGVSTNITTEIWRDGRYISDIMNGWVSLGSTIIEDGGVMKIDILDSVI